MKTRFFERLLFVLIFSITFLMCTEPVTCGAYTPAQDSTRVDSSQQATDILRNVDVKITYSWNPDEPDVFENVSCQLIKKDNEVVELKIIRSDATDRISFKPEYMQFEVKEHQSKKVIAKGP
jgi:hypothetical protein